MISDMDLSSGPIASGRTADVYATPDGQILKLLKPEFHPFMLDAESTRTAAVHAAGVPVPRVGDHVEVDGRPGLLFESIDGPTMLEVALSDLDKMDGFVVPFTNLHVNVFNASAGNDLPDVKDYLAAKIDRADLPLAQRTQAKDHMVGLPDGASTLHGDYHPGNILLTADGPIIIDWGDAMVTDRHYELAKLHLDLFDCDTALLRDFLEASDWPVAADFARKAMGLALYRQAQGVAQHHTMDVFYKLPKLFPLAEIATLDELANVLFAV